MGLRLAIGSSLCPVRGRGKQKITCRRSGKSAWAGHGAGGGTRRVHEESVKAGGDWNRCGGTTCTRKSAAQPQCGQIGSERGVGTGAGAASGPGGNNARARSNRCWRPRLASRP